MVGAGAPTDEYARANAYARTREHVRPAAVAVVLKEKHAGLVNHEAPVWLCGDGQTSKKLCQAALVEAQVQWSPCMTGGSKQSRARLASGWLPQPRVSECIAQAPIKWAAGRQRQNLTRARPVAARPAAPLLYPSFIIVQLGWPRLRREHAYPPCATRFGESSRVGSAR